MQRQYRGEPAIRRVEGVRQGVIGRALVVLLLESGSPSGYLDLPREGNCLTVIRYLHRLRNNRRIVCFYVDRINRFP